MFEHFCGVTADNSNSHFKSRLVCVFVFVYVIRFSVSEIRIDINRYSGLDRKIIFTTFCV